MPNEKRCAIRHSVNYVSEEISYIRLGQNHELVFFTIFSQKGFHKWEFKLNFLQNICVSGRRYDDDDSVFKRKRYSSARHKIGKKLDCLPTSSERSKVNLC